MDIKIMHLLEGARAARGLTVIIDVFRAFSLECYFAAAGAAEIIPVGSEALCRQLKEADPSLLLAGERHGFTLPGFDYGNSPTQVEHADLTGKKVIHTTSAGTQGIENAVNADEVITGSLANAAAIARYIKLRQPEQVSLVGMGVETKKIADEDLLCAEYIRSLLLDEPFDLQPRIDALKSTTGARFFVAEHQESMPERDFFLCTQPNRFDFVLQVSRQADGLNHARRIDV